MSMLARLLSAGRPTTPIALINSYSMQNAASGTTLIINKPNGTLQNDLMLALCGADGGGDTWSGDTGWTEAADQASNPTLRLAHKATGSAEGANYTFTSSGAGTKKGGCILTFRYAAFGNIGAIATTFTAPGITVPFNSSWLLYIAMTSNASTAISLPAGFASLIADADAAGPSYVVGWKAVNAGASGDHAGSGGGTNKASILLSLKPG